MNWRREDVVAPEVERDPDPERERWLVTCPHCLHVCLGDSPEDADDAWHDHEDTAHPPLPPRALHGRELLDALLDPVSAENKWARAALRRYWRGWTSAPDRQTPFTGAWFDHLGHELVADPVTGRAIYVDPAPDRFTGIDLVAVTTLGVDVPALTSLVLLDPDDAFYASARLAGVPRGLPLHLVLDFDRTLGPKSEAGRLWDIVRDTRTKTGRTITSKIIARKRPDLVPVYDRRIAARLDLPPNANYWMWWWQWWRELGHDEKAADLRASAASGADGVSRTVRNVSLLRVLDVAIWQYDKHFRPQLEAR